MSELGPEPRHRKVACPLFLVALLTAGCQTLPHLPDPTLAELAAKGGYLKGPPSGLHRPRVLNDVDFVYDVQWAGSSDRVALSRLGSRSFDLFVWSLAQPGQPVFEAALNPHEFDVEAVAFSPDGKWVGAASRDGMVRIFDAATGKRAGGFLTEEPLVSIAFHPAGRFVAVGSEHGTVTLVKTDGLGFASDARPHLGPVRALAFAADGRLFTAGWDKTVAVLTTQELPTPVDSAAVRFERKGGFARVRGTLNGAASVLFALDARMPQVLMLHSALALAIGLDPSKLTDTVSITSSFGTQIARVAHGTQLSFKGLGLKGVDAVICDACIPAGAQAVLGQGFMDAVTIAFDDVRAQALLERKAPVDGAGEPRPSLTVAKRFTFPAFPNDVSIDHAGKVLGVAFSEAKAERSPEVYQREQRGEVEPEREWDVGARVDADTGEVLEKFRGHRGVVSTAGISPDGATLATGGWDRRLLLHLGGLPRAEKFGGILRRVRFSPDGRWLAAAAWTPQNPVGAGKTDPSALVFELAYGAAEIVPR